MARDDRDDRDRGWAPQLLVVVGVLLVVALMIGGVVSVIALGAAKVTGLDSARPRATQSPSLYLPSGKPTTGLDDYPAPSRTPSPSSEAGESASASASPSHKARGISLVASPRKVSPSQRINLTGLYVGGEGARLQVERFEGGRWTDFPVGASVTSGKFTTYVTTSRPGVQRFRVVDPLSDKTSNPVRVTVG